MIEQTEQTEPKAPIRDVKLRQGALQTSDHFTTRWCAVVAAEHDFEDILKPSYWSVVASRISTDDLIEVRSEDQRFYAEVYVKEANRQQVVVKVLVYYSLQDEDLPSLPSDVEHAYKWKGPAWGHCVVRISDGTALAKNMASKAECLRWITTRHRNAA